VDFAEIIGNNRQIQTLKNRIDTEKINHSYLFEGEKGVGKMDVALAFSKALLCKSEGNKPCNVCSSCIKFKTNNHPDFKHISATKGLIQKKEIETLIEDISILPFESKRKVFLIEDGDLMRSESQNALLKTLEEPPKYVVIIIVTSNSNKILSTISSRCQNIKFNSNQNTENILKSDNFTEIRNEIIDIINNLINGNKLKVFTSVDLFSNNKDRIDEVLDIMIYWFRDLAIYKEIGESELLLNKDKIGELSNQSFLEINRIYDIIYKIETTKINIKRNINFNLSIETMLLNI
jgi:DNA polymerase III subunit delta'